MKINQITPEPLLWVLGFFMTVCVTLCGVALVYTILYEIASFFAF